MGTHYRNRPEFQQLEELLVDQIIYQSFDIMDKRRPKTTFKVLFRKNIRPRLEAFRGTPGHFIYQYLVRERFFEIMQTVARKMSHGKLVLKEEDVKDVTPDTPIHDFFDILDKLYTAKEELENVKNKNKQ